MTKGDVMVKNKPTKFDDLSAEELYRSAIEDFAVPVDEADKGKKKVLLAALVESGISWADYVAQHPEVAPDEDEAVVEEIKPTKPAKKAAGRVRTKEGIETNTPDEYLIKMTRENPLYQTRGYTFTQENPYNLVSAEDANYILTKEDGFTIATPAELQEYYG